jgi:hypothetical protein
VLGGKSYYALPVLLFALAAGAIPLDRWATRRRLLPAGAVFVAIGLVSLPIALPALPLPVAVRHGVVKARSDYQASRSRAARYAARSPKSGPTSSRHRQTRPGVQASATNTGAGQRPNARG